MALNGERLREAREQKGFTQRELADLCSITLHQISRYENEKSDITADSLRVIAKHLEVSTDYLLGLSNNPKGHKTDNEFTEDEYDLIQTLRREGWLGVVHYSADRLAKPPAHLT